MRQKIPYYIRLSIVLIILISPILAFQLGWHFFGKENGLLFAFCYGIVAVTFACYKFYVDDWRDED
jgi:4-amino-4-deoxy-L-arabinose transferase-like glycosyltransferase|tara:strand:+ start:49 stop:246 length:198 start_codon:yes stop_codon:yes gene_type:complete